MLDEKENEIFRNMKIFLLHKPKEKKMESSIGLIENYIIIQ